MQPAARQVIRKGGRDEQQPDRPRGHRRHRAGRAALRHVLGGVILMALAFVLALVAGGMLLGAALLSPARAHDHYGTWFGAERPYTSPDGSSHAGIGTDGTIYCFVNGEPKS
jgi:hypothetical protein